MQKRNMILFLSIFIMGPGTIFMWGQEQQTKVQINSKNTISTDSDEEQHWYKNSVIYNLDVEVFKDSDRDGIGDFRGLTDRLGYIDSLGVDAIWLAPFQPTPNGDDGYDVMNYFAVDRRLGTFQDFRDFLEKAGELDIRILMDLVVNHTSIKHPWFQEARRDENSPYKDWYIWSEEQPQNYDRGMVFPGVQEEVWTYDSIAGEYYFHRFYAFQPGLDNHDPEVQDEVKRIIKFWMDQGIKGFRLDAVPFMLEIPKKEGEVFEHDFDLLKDIRQYVSSLDEDAILLGEANVKPEENEDYFVEDEGLHMMFNFFVNQHLFYALATGKAEPLKDALERTKGIPEEAEWGQFLRNHDEVDLGRLDDEQRAEVFEQFGPEEHMQVYNRGIRRRLAPMLGNDREHLEVAYSLLFSLPSSPVMRYGDEIGMGDDLSLKERIAVRTPMQWDDSENGGFTENDTAVRPVIDDGAYSYEKVNVEDAKSDPGSLLNWTIQMVELRKNSPEISYGSWEFVDTDTDNVLAIRYQWEDKDLLVIHNLSSEGQQINIREEEVDSSPLSDLLDSHTFKPLNGSYSFDLNGYGYKWLRIVK